MSRATVVALVAASLLASAALAWRLPAVAQDRGGPRRDHDHCTLGPGCGPLGGLHYHDGDAHVLCGCCEVCGADGPVDHWHPAEETIQLGPYDGTLEIAPGSRDLELAPTGESGPCRDPACPHGNGFGIHSHDPSDPDQVLWHAVEAETALLLVHEAPLGRGIVVRRYLLVEDDERRLWAACGACQGSPAAQDWTNRDEPNCAACQGLGLVLLPERR